MFELKGTVPANKNLKSLMLFLIWSFTVGMCISFYYKNPLENVIDFDQSMILGTCAFFASYIFFSKLKQNFSTTNDFLKEIAKIFGNAYALAVIMSFVDFFVLFTPIPITIKLVKDSIVGGWQTFRITGSSAESSWMATHLLLVMPMYWFLVKNGVKRKWNAFLFFIAVISFLGCLSLNGYLILAFASIAYLFVLAVKRKRMIQLLIGFVVISIMCFFTWLALQKIFAGMDAYYALRIFRLMDVQSFKDILFVDGSVFIRLGFPIIGWQIFADYPLLGTGAGSFAYMVRDYLLNFYPEALKYEEVWYYFKTGTSANTAIYSKLFSEFGLLGAILFLRFYLGSIKCFFKLNNKVFVFYGCILAVLLFQQGSYAYVPMWVGLAVANNL